MQFAKKSALERLATNSVVFVMNPFTRTKPVQVREYGHVLIDEMQNS